MQICAAVAAELAGLSAGHPGVASAVLALAAGARGAVTSLLGMTVTLSSPGTQDGVALRFTLLEDDADPRETGSSLRLPRSTEPTEPIVTVVLYAATPGAFLDLATDLAFLDSPGLDAAELDQHLGPRPADVTGALRQGSIVSEAVGALLDRGRTHTQARAELDALAAAAGTSRIVEAGRLLDTLTAGDR